MVRRTGGKRRRGGAVRRNVKRRNTGSSGMYVPVKSRMGLVMDQLITTRMYRIANVSVTAASFAGAYDFKLNYLPQSGEFTALFDVYKIWKVDIQFIPKYNSSDFSTGGAGFGLPTMYVVEDRNDVAVPASINELMEYNNCKAQRFDRPLHYTCWPTLNTISGSGAALGLVINDNQRDMFLRTSEPGVQYCGVKWGLDLPLGVEVFRMDVVFKYYMKLKDVK
jgi:hypothetical protein